MRRNIGFYLIMGESHSQYYRPSYIGSAISSQTPKTNWSVVSGFLPAPAAASSELNSPCDEPLDPLKALLGRHSKLCSKISRHAFNYTDTQTVEHTMHVLCPLWQMKASLQIWYVTTKKAMDTLKAQMYPVSLVAWF